MLVSLDRWSDMMLVQPVKTLGGGGTYKALNFIGKDSLKLIDRVYSDKSLIGACEMLGNQR